MEEDYRDKSEFNMAFYTLGRLNYSLYLCSEHMRQMDLSAWFFELINLYTELCTEMQGNLLGIITNNKLNSKQKVKEDELKLCEDFIKELEPIIEKYNLNLSDIELRKELFTKLRLWNMMLRKIMKDSGLLTKIKDDMRFALSS